ncbi:hypothetical protein OBBRIDRAFT_663112 [Obba rivulosa]|uniref:Uncharacterized protein n=1 Tax=Obba rivulosa TaxID=1052685 RepID=A0A8E2DL56_9APHY|nr:hypothetical protein OBBRIDRAFT_663112 [Obba rivulosa]
MDSAWSSLSHVGYIQYVPKFSMYSALTRVYSRCTLTLKMHSNSAPHRHAEYRRSDPSLSSACTGLGHLLMPTVADSQYWHVLMRLAVDPRPRCDVTVPVFLAMLR